MVKDIHLKEAIAVLRTDGHRVACDGWDTDGLDRWEDDLHALSLEDTVHLTLVPEERDQALGEMNAEERKGALERMLPTKRAHALAGMGVEERLAELRGLGKNKRASALTAMTDSVRGETLSHMRVMERSLLLGQLGKDNRVVTLPWICHHMPVTERVALLQDMTSDDRDGVLASLCSSRANEAFAAMEPEARHAMIVGLPLEVLRHVVVALGAGLKGRFLSHGVLTLERLVALLLAMEQPDRVGALKVMSPEDREAFMRHAGPKVARDSRHLLSVVRYD
jgi:hypothetical protein